MFALHSILHRETGRSLFLYVSRACEKPYTLQTIKSAQERIKGYKPFELGIVSGPWIRRIQLQHINMILMRELELVKDNKKTLDESLKVIQSDAQEALDRGLKK